MPVQYSYTSTPPMGRTACTEPQCLYSTAIPLLPLWAVGPAKSLSVCTVQLYLYSPYGLYGLQRASVSVQRCTLPYFLPASNSKNKNLITLSWTINSSPFKEPNFNSHLYTVYLQYQLYMSLQY